MVNAFQDVVDEQESAGVELSENVAEDFIEYFRGNVVGHEEQGLLMYLGLLTGWAADDTVHVNTLGIGPPGSGKSLTKNTVEDLFDDTDTYTKTSASANAILDSVEWDLALVAPMDEYDKIDKPIIEVLKSSNQIDDGFSKDRNVEDPDAQGGYSPEEVSAEANPWVLLYAPSGKKASVDDELEDRAMILYFSNDKHTRRGIMRKEFGHENIAAPERDEEYIYDTHALAARLREHIRDFPVHTEYTETDDGERRMSARSGATYVYMPRWVVYVCEPIFDIDQDYSNRVFSIVNNLIRSSALLNRDYREQTTVDVYLDEDSTETERREAVVVGPQDVANVLSCLPTLLSTTHQLTPLKRHILDAVDATEPITDGDGTTVQDVRSWLDDNDIPHPTEGTLRKKMNELHENYYLQKFEHAGGKDGKAHVYERRDEGALQTPNIYDLQRRADRDGIQLAAEKCVSIDPSDPFDGCSDPIRDQPFVETVREFEQQFSGETVSEPDTDAATFMGNPDDSGSDSGTGGGDSGAPDSSSGGQSSLDAITEDGVDAPDVDDSSDDGPELDPDGVPENPTEQVVFERLQEVDGQPYGPEHDVTHYVGAVSTVSHSASQDMSGTVVDPEHELWQDRPDLKNDRVVSEADALRELADAYDSLREKGLLVEDSESGPEAMHVLRVASRDDVSGN